MKLIPTFFFSIFDCIMFLFVKQLFSFLKLILFSFVFTFFSPCYAFYFVFDLVSFLLSYYLWSSFPILYMSDSSLLSCLLIYILLFTFTICVFVFKQHWIVFNDIETSLSSIKNHCTDLYLSCVSTSFCILLISVIN